MIDIIFYQVKLILLVVLIPVQILVQIQAVVHLPVQIHLLALIQVQVHLQAQIQVHFPAPIQVQILSYEREDELQTNYDPLNIIHQHPLVLIFDAIL